MSTFTLSTFKSGVGLAAVLAAVAIAAPAQAGAFYAPRSTIPVDPLPRVEQTCGAVFAPSWAGPRSRFEKVKDLGACPVEPIVRWAGPRGTIPVDAE